MVVSTAMNPPSTLKTTEFITSMIPVALGILFLILGLIQKNQPFMDQGLYLLLGGTGVYGISRGLTKLGQGIGTPTSVPIAPVVLNDQQAAKEIAKIP